MQTIFYMPSRSLWIADVVQNQHLNSGIAIGGRIAFLIVCAVRHKGRTLEWGITVDSEGQSLMMDDGRQYVVS